jgi:hypothetical protein
MQLLGVASTGHLYLYAQTNPDVPPQKMFWKDIVLVQERMIL